MVTPRPLSNTSLPTLWGGKSTLGFRRDDLTFFISGSDLGLDRLVGILGRRAGQEEANRGTPSDEPDLGLLDFYVAPSEAGKSLQFDFRKKNQRYSKVEVSDNHSVICFEPIRCVLEVLYAGGVGEVKFRSIYNIKRRMGMKLTHDWSTPSLSILRRRPSPLARVSRGEPNAVTGDRQPR